MVVYRKSLAVIADSVSDTGVLYKGAQWFLSNQPNCCCWNPIVTTKGTTRAVYHQTSP